MPWMKGQTKPMQNAAKVGRMNTGANLRMGRCTRLTSFLFFAKVISLSLQWFEKGAGVARPYQFVKLLNQPLAMVYS